jgi:hypothetical protein
MRGIQAQRPAPVIPTTPEKLRQEDHFCPGDQGQSRQQDPASKREKGDHFIVGDIQLLKLTNFPLVKKCFINTSLCCTPLMLFSSQVYQ